MELGCDYHIYQHAVHGNKIFWSEDNFAHFLSLYLDKVTSLVHTHSFVFIDNHYHIAVTTKNKEEILELDPEVLKKWNLTPESTEKQFKRRVSQQFANMLTAYVQSVNKSLGRKGAMFRGNFHRKRITSPAYFQTVICYIHHNAVKHRIVKYYKEYIYSSFHHIAGTKATFLTRERLFEVFGSEVDFYDAHDAFQPKLDDLSSANIERSVKYKQSLSYKDFKAVHSAFGYVSAMIGLEENHTARQKGLVEKLYDIDTTQEEQYAIQSPVVLSQEVEPSVGNVAEKPTTGKPKVAAPSIADQGVIMTKILANFDAQAKKEPSVNSGENPT